MWLLYSIWIDISNMSNDNKQIEFSNTFVKQVYIACKKNGWRDKEI